MSKLKSRIALDSVIAITSILIAVFSITTLLTNYNDRKAALKREIAPAKEDVSLINSALSDHPYGRPLTREYLQKLAKSYSTTIFDAAIHNPGTEKKTPEEQDVLHRIQLMEIKTDRLESQIDKLSKSEEKPWWKDPNSLLLVALIWLCDKFFGSVAGDLVTIAWRKTAKRIGIDLPGKEPPGA